MKHALPTRCIVVASVVALSVLARTAGAQSGLGRCAEPLGALVQARGVATPVHPDRLSEQFAAAIVARDWESAITGYRAVVEETLSGMPNASIAFRQLRDSVLVANEQASDEMIEWAGRPGTRKVVLPSGTVTQFRPVVRQGQIRILETDVRPRGIPIDTTVLSSAEVEAICWSSWSLYELAGAVNFETVPAAFLRVDAQATRWERYRDNGPLQLPHELLANRFLRSLSGGGTGSRRYSPPRWELVAIHPFVGLELRRAQSGVTRDETLAVEVVGFTLWTNDWRRNIGASWVTTSSADGALGQGALVRLGGLLTAGVIDRKLVGGGSTRALLVQLDAARLVASDGMAKRALGLLGVSGEILRGKE